MQPFLKLVAQDLYSRYGSNISDITLVFPNRRAGLFFGKYLAQELSNPIWTPTIATVGDIMKSLSGLKSDDQISLVARLYRIYGQITQTNQPFENFYYWGQVMLSDFNEVDKYLIDAKQLFGNIKDLKEIDEKFSEFTPEQQEALKGYLGVMEQSDSSEIKQSHLNIWNNLYDIYNAFWNELENEGLAYEGMQYRKAAQNLSAGDAINKLPNPIAFIGFNALNECEKQLFKQCQNSLTTLFYWDYDPRFLNQKENLAGLFINENLKHFPNAIHSTHFEQEMSTPKEIKIFSAPSSVSQAKILPKLLDDITANGGKLDLSTAIVLPQENILIPTLQAIPSEIDALNITIGYPIKETPAYSLMEFLIRLQSNAKVNTKGETQFYHKDVVDILNHPYIQLCEPYKAENLLHNILKTNRLFPPAHLLGVTPFLSSIFVSQGEVQDIGRYLLSITHTISQFISNLLSDDENSELRIELEFLFALHKSLTRLNDMLSRLEVSIVPKLFMVLLRKAFNEERVSFSGEPLNGLQVIGFLETRALDFENLIILSFNDDILPGKSRPVSFIAPSLRFAFGLPTSQQRDSIYAYSFYRLMNRSKNVYLVYNDRTEGLTSGEMSRFALQLQLDPIYGKPTTINLGYHIQLTPNEPIEIPKTPEVMEALTNNLQRDGVITLSPSGLTSYLMCPLRFYFRYAVGLTDEDEITEEVGAIEFGNILHSAMQELYNSMGKKEIQQADVQQIITKQKSLKELLHSIFCEEFLKGEHIPLEEFSGRNQVAFNSILYTINKMLRFDRDRARFTLMGHEQDLSISLTIPKNHTNSPITINLKGIADRIEENAGALWLIDYKTGNPSQKGVFVDIDELFDEEKVMNRKEVFQAFCYSLALSEIYSQKPIVPLLWFVKKFETIDDLNINRSEGRKRYPVTDFNDYKTPFAQGLLELCEDIFNPNKSFYQTDDKKRCEFCSYKDICNR